MKKISNIIYWTSTILLAFGMLASAISQLLHVKDMDELITHVGYPLYFMYIIGVWKILGVVAILIPKQKLLKEWAYAGFFFFNVGCFNFTFGNWRWWKSHFGTTLSDYFYNFILVFQTSR